MADKWELSTAYPYGDAKEVVTHFDVVMVATFTEDDEEWPVRLRVSARDDRSMSEAYLSPDDAEEVARLLLEAAERARGG